MPSCPDCGMCDCDCKKTVIKTVDKATDKEFLDILNARMETLRKENTKLKNENNNLKKKLAEATKTKEEIKDELMKGFKKI